MNVAACGVCRVTLPQLSRVGRSAREIRGRAGWAPPGTGKKPAACAGAEVLEGDVVVHVVELARGFLRGLVLARGDGLSCLAAARFSRTLPTSEHLHALGDAFRRGAPLPSLLLPLPRPPASFALALPPFLQPTSPDPPQ